MLSTKSIEQILTTIPLRSVGLIGDLFLDRYLDLDGTLTEPSLETGLDAYQVSSVRSYPGALGTVINNLAALGVGRIVPITFIGDDGEGYELRQALRVIPSIVHETIRIVPERRTPTYTKPMLNQPGELPRELNRIDIKNRQPTPPEVEAWLMAALEKWWDRMDMIVVLDQVSEVDCGVVTAAVRERIADLAEANPEKFILADSRERISQFRNVSVKPNDREMAMAPPDGWNRWTFWTRGEQGIQLRDAHGEVTRIPGYPVSGPIDIVGAGDACSAGICCGMVTGLSVSEAASFGNLVASITVQQIGTTGSASPDQVRHRWAEVGA